MHLFKCMEHYLIVSLSIKIAKHEQSYKPILENCTVRRSWGGSGFCVLEIHRMQYRDLSPFSQLDQQYIDGRTCWTACCSGLEEKQYKPR